MYRVALSVMLGTVSMLVAYVQFRALPGQENYLDLTTTLREALIVCGSIESCLPSQLQRRAFTGESANPKVAGSDGRERRPRALPPVSRRRREFFQS
jgi:hypothetical protein